MQIGCSPLMRCAYAATHGLHSKGQIKQIAASMKRFGFTNPIWYSDDTNHRRPWSVRGRSSWAWRACRWFGLSHLSADERRAYVLADNRLARGGWIERFSVELQRLIGLISRSDLNRIRRAGERLILDEAREAGEPAGPGPPSRNPLVGREPDGDLLGSSHSSAAVGDARSPRLPRVLDKARRNSSSRSALHCRSTATSVARRIRTS